MAKPTYTTWELDPTWAHYSDILSAVPLNENTGTPADLIGANTVTFTGCVWTTADGSGAIAAAKDADSDVFGVDVTVPNPGTVILIYDPGSGFAGSADSLWGSSTSNSVGVRRAGGNGRLRWGGTDTVNTNIGTDWRSASEDFAMVCTVDSSGALLRVDGSEYTASGDADANSGDFRIQEGYGTADNGAQILGWVILDKVLTSAEASAVESSPWAWAREASGGGGISIPVVMNHLRNQGIA